MRKFSKYELIIFLIIFISALLRFWNLAGLLHFTLDEELEAFIVKNIVSGFHLPAIGVSVAPVGIYLSPLFYYLAAIPFWIGRLNPISWGITASSLGVLSTLFFYFINEKMFSKTVALFSSLLYATSFLMVLYDKHFWNVTPIIFVSLITIYGLYKIINKQYKWAIAIGVALSIGISSHLSTFVLVLLTVITLIIFKISIWKKTFLIGIGILIVSQLPLVVFELRHSFYQTKVLTKFFLGEHSGISFSRVFDNLMLLLKVFSRLIYTFGNHDFAREHTYGIEEIALRDLRIPGILIVVSCLILFIFSSTVIRNWKNPAYKLHGMLFLITVFSLFFYSLMFKGTIFEFYLIVCFPTLFIAVSLIFDYLWKRGGLVQFGGLVIFVVLLISNSLAVFNSYHSYGFDKKIHIVNWVENQLGDDNYILHSIGVDHKYEGYRYLFEEFYKEPVKSYVDAQLSWLYTNKNNQDIAKKMVVIISTEAAYKDQIEKEKALYTPYQVSSLQVGEINTMIVNIP